MLDVALHDETFSEETRSAWVRSILRATSTVFGVGIEDLIGPRRSRAVAHARFCAALLLRDICHLSYPEIAKELHRADHTTAVHAVRRAVEKTYSDEVYARRVLEAQKIAAAMYDVECIDVRRRAALSRRVATLEKCCRWLLDVVCGNAKLDLKVVDQIGNYVYSTKEDRP